MLAPKSKVARYEKEIQEYASRLRDLFDDMNSNLRESEYIYRSIVDGAADGIITIDKENSILSWNIGAEEIFGFSAEEAIGKKIDQLIIKSDVQKSSDYIYRKVIQGEKFRSYEAIRYNKNGEPRNLLISATPIFDESGTVTMISLIYKDITELQQAQEKLIISEKQATLGVIAGSIGHELNNIVGGLLVEAHLLLKRAENAQEVKKIAERFLSYLEKVALHGRNLLSLSKPSKPQLKEIDLNEVLRTTTETLILSGVLKHFTVETDLGTDLPPVCADRGQIEQVIRNLEINAAHAMGKTGTLRIATRLSADGKYVEMLIADSGGGIPAEIMEKIFEPFFTTKSEGLGTGLGLPIVKQIIDDQKGELTIKSEKGEGTTVTVGLPIACD